MSFRLAKSRADSKVALTVILFQKVIFIKASCTFLDVR